MPPRPPPSKFFQNSATRPPKNDFALPPVMPQRRCPHATFGGRRSVDAVSPSAFASHRATGNTEEFQIFRLPLRALPAYCATLRLPPWVTHLSFPLDMRYRAGVRSRSCRPSGCLAAGLVRIPSGMSHPSGYSCSLPRKPPLAWFPARPAGMCSREPSAHPPVHPAILCQKSALSTSRAFSWRPSHYSKK